MSFLYCTADAINPDTGAGKVVWNESQALKELGDCEVWERSKLECQGEDPWKWDDKSIQLLDPIRSGWAGLGLVCSGRVRRGLVDSGMGGGLQNNPPHICHFYAGTFSKTIALLKEQGCKISYTAAAHDLDLSKREHRRMGLPFSYPHLVDPKLWAKYLQGYLDADALICPSQHSANVMRKHGATNRIEVIPHGVTLSDKIAAMPSRFTVGALGNMTAPDKGIIYLLQAWKKLNYSDSLLVLAGRDSLSPFCYQMVERFGGSNIVLSGWIPNVSDFYNRISLLVQPSVTEGFGCEVVEALAYSRPAIAAEGCGAADVLPEGWKFPSANVDKLATLIDDFKREQRIGTGFVDCHEIPRKIAEQYAWPIIREKYVKLWKELI